MTPAKRCYKLMLTYRFQIYWYRVYVYSIFSLACMGFTLLTEFSTSQQNKN